jgi:hypothetical protein
MEKIPQEQLLKRLKSHRKGLLSHLKNASFFLTKCQVLEPFVDSGFLRGTVCPWEIVETGPIIKVIVEDFHDTLEAIWVWSYYTYESNESTFVPHIEAAWDYVLQNFDRFIPPNQDHVGLYDCAHMLNTNLMFQRAFAEEEFFEWVEIAGNRLANYLKSLSSVKGREYSDPWWMAACLANAAQGLGNTKWLEVAIRFVQQTIIKKRNPFLPFEKESEHQGPGNHDFLSQTATKILALLACSVFVEDIQQLIESKILPLIPTKLVTRHLDENAWNASVAAALAKSYVYTKRSEFLQSYFSIMDELAKRAKNKAALPRSPQFPLKESWVTFFYAYAYAAVLGK